jgi:AmiR/NasT family two-component response regulator
MDRPARVLIVEDEALISLDIKRLLSNSGYVPVGVASSYDQAMRAIGTSAPDLVLIDIHIRGSADGIEAARDIRRKFQLPVIFVTAHADKQTLDRARESEPFGYIVKPISALTLTSTIEMALHKRQMEKELEQHRAWLTTILHGIPDSVLVTDLARKVQFLNTAAEELTGLSRSEALGKDVDAILPLTAGEQTKGLLINNISMQECFGLSCMRWIALPQFVSDSQIWSQCLTRNRVVYWWQQRVRLWAGAASRRCRRRLASLGK